MDLYEFKQKHIRESLGINDDFGIIYTFIDFANVNHWGTFVLLPKCNFDVEICVDAIKTVEGYKTFCLFSSDADFVHLVRFLKGKGKKVILVKGGHILHSLRHIVDIVVSAQDIKQYIAIKKARPSQNSARSCG